MNVLVVGGGGREHALVWKIRQSPLVKRVVCAPGNPGIAEIADVEPIAAEDLPGQLELARRFSADLVVVGPEAPLCDGLTDLLVSAGFRVFGPSKTAAEIEGDKAFARDLCRKERIASPQYWVFDDLRQAESFFEGREEGPLVVKASGLAAGKGVTVAANKKEALAAVRECLVDGRFGDSGARVVLEEKLEGPEVSSIALTDGKTLIPLEPARDHKPVFDGDEGPNTGGMGAISPPRSVPPKILEQIEQSVLLPSIHGMNSASRSFTGFLYAGLMLTAQGPKVLEFNCRMGDPETQPLMMRLKSDLVPLLLGAADGDLASCDAPEWDPRPAVCVVACAPGYPGSYPKGLHIDGIDELETGPDLQVFHAGTGRRGGDLVTAGGRVLSVCALGTDLEDARARAYGALEGIRFEGKHFRTDIGYLG
ncbi:MAG: phosphoribosylamine--glycine ligase [Planctomycetota bacterium]